MKAPSLKRPSWAIDRKLLGLVGKNIRVAAQEFVPLKWNGEPLSQLVPVSEFILPDNTRPGGFPVFVEGRLEVFERQVGVVFVRLGKAPRSHNVAQGLLGFRGQPAVLLSGPALVKLAFPHFVERTPLSPAAYWSELELPPSSPAASISAPAKKIHPSSGLS